MEYSTIGCTLKMDTNVLYGLNSVPQMGGEPAKIDVSNMADKIDRFIPGRQTAESLSFEFYYNKGAVSGAGENVTSDAFAALKEAEGVLKDWTLTYADGSSYSWKGKPTVYMNAMNPNEAMKFTLSVSLESGLKYNAGTTGG